MNYIGQASSFSVRAEDSDLTVQRLHAAFLKDYEDRYGHANPGRQIAVSGVRVVAVAASAKPNVRSYQEANTGAGGSKTRPVVFNGDSHDCAVLSRAALRPGDKHPGPAIIEESGSTTVVPPGWTVGVDELLNIRLTNTAKSKPH